MVLVVTWYPAIREFVAASFNPTDSEDQILLLSIGSHWAEMITKSLSSGRFDDVSGTLFPRTWHGCNTPPYKMKHARPWVKFMSTEELLAAVDLIQANLGRQSAVACNILEDILGTLQHRTPKGSVQKVSALKLLELQGVLPGSTLLEDMLSATLISQLPLGFDGQIAFAKGQTLSAVLSKPGPSHMSDIRSLPSDLISRFLEKESWTDSAASTIVILLYSNPASLPAYTTWLNSKKWTRFGIHALASTLVAFLDCTSLTGGDLSQVHDDILHGLMGRLLLGERAGVARNLECIRQILELSGTRRARLVSALQERIQDIPIMDFAFETAFLARKLLGISGCGDLTTSIVDRVLQWAVRHLSTDPADSEDATTSLGHLSA